VVFVEQEYFDHANYEGGKKMSRFLRVPNRYLVICVAILVFLAMTFAGGCAPEEPAVDEPVEDPAEEPTEDPAEEPAETVELVLCHFMAPMHPLHVNVLEPWAEEVSARTDGRVQIYNYPANELVAAGDNFSATLEGVIDIGFVLPAYTPGRFPLTEFLEYPFMFSSPLQSNLTAWELMETHPALRETEYADVEVLWWGTTDLGHFLMTEPVETMEDLQGLEIRSPGPVYNDVLAELGATPVTMPVPEVYDAIDRGIVDGTLLPYSTLYSFSLDEVVDYVLELDMYATPLHMVANKDAWAQISPGDQEIIRELLDEFPRTIGEQYEREAAEGKELAEEAGITIKELSPEEAQAFRDQLEPLIEEWLDEKEADGLPAREVYELMQEIAEKHE